MVYIIHQLMVLLQILLSEDEVVLLAELTDQYPVSNHAIRAQQHITLQETQYKHAYILAGSQKNYPLPDHIS